MARPSWPETLEQAWKVRLAARTLLSASFCPSVHVVALRHPSVNSKERGKMIPLSTCKPSPNVNTTWRKSC